MSGGIVGPRPDRETRALLLASRTELEPAGRQALAEVLVAGVDWARLERLGRRHGTLSLMLENITSAAAAALPEDRHARWKELAVAQACRNMNAAVELCQVLAELERAGIPAMTFKGPSLAVSAYPGLAFRAFADLDVIVPGPQVDDALDVLRTLGYRPRLELDGAQAHARRRLDYAVPMEKEGASLPVDLHWAFSRSYVAGDSKTLDPWSDPVTVDVVGRQVTAPSPVLHLMLLSVHGAKHGPTPWPCLKWVVDVEGILRRHASADWGRLLDLARRHDALRTVLLATALARDLLDVRLPAVIGETLRAEARVDELARQVARWLLSAEPVTPSFTELTRFELALKARWPGKLAYLARRTFVPTRRDWSGLDLPTYLYPVYFAVRVLRLGTRYLVNPARVRRLWSGAAIGSTGVDRDDGTPGA